MREKLTGVPETMLIPLWAKAIETQKNNAIVKDRKAEQILSQIDYNFSKFKGSWMTQTGVSVRTMLLDKALETFVKQHGPCIAVNLGAGLDTRCERFRDYDIHWYDVDLPQSIELRKTFFGGDQNHWFIASSIFDSHWIDAIEKRQRPVIIIAEGLFMYFSEDELKPFLKKMSAAFAGADLFFEMLAPMLVGKEKIHDTLKNMENSVKFKWGLKNSRDMENWDPKIQFVTEWDYYDFHKARWKWLGYIARSRFIRPKLSNRIVHLKFIT